MGSGGSGYKIGKDSRGTSGSRDTGFRKVNGHTTEVNANKQKKHIPGAKGYEKGKSIFIGSVDDAQKLVSEFAGTGTWIDSRRERVDFGKTIGVYKAGPDDPGTSTTMGTIRYSKTGTHIVPARPRER